MKQPIRGSMNRRNFRTGEHSELARHAHKIWDKALRRGEVFKPNACEGCGRVRYLFGHHPDYAKPLEVLWLCFECHKAWHHPKGRQVCLPKLQPCRVQVLVPSKGLARAWWLVRLVQAAFR